MTKYGSLTLGAECTSGATDVCLVEQDLWMAANPDEVNYSTPCIRIEVLLEASPFTRDTR